MHVCLGRVAALVFVTLLFASLADAQTLTGRVVDPQGGLVVRAQVRLSGALLPATRTTTTGTDGTFTFLNVAPGRYALRVGLDRSHATLGEPATR